MFCTWLPIGYFANLLFPSETNLCSQFTQNMTLSECFSFPLCNRKCGQDGGLSTLILFLVLLTVILALVAMKKCLNAFKTNEEITMIRGELQPLVATQ